MLIAGNIVSFLGCLLMVCIGLIKKKRTMLAVQCGQFALMGTGNFLLGSASGGISNIVAIVRIWAFGKFKVTVWLKLGFLALQAGLTALFGADTWIEWIPFFSMILYTWYLDTDNPILFKLVNIAGVAMWVVHDLHYHNYVTVVFNIATVISTTIGIALLLRDKKKEKQANGT